MNKITKQMYQELILQTLAENRVRTATFKGDTKFAKKYAYIYVLHDGNRTSLRVATKDLTTIFLTFNFDYTLDYARIIDMIETDLFSYYHKVETKYFDFEMYP